METPTGSRFYLTATFKPTERFLGAFAFETSAYSKLSEWPGGGVVGIHGTNQPALIPGNPSSGCIRLKAGDLRSLGRLLEIGTPVWIT
jgi:lipoprotein-anchoring transpeptidase ErfK/SrfK